MFDHRGVYSPSFTNLVVTIMGWVEEFAFFVTYLGLGLFCIAVVYAVAWQAFFNDDEVSRTEEYLDALVPIDTHKLHLNESDDSGNGGATKESPHHHSYLSDC